jgi:hypothetical protein
MDREILRKHFNIYLFNCKKFKLKDDLSIVEKFKNICEKIEGDEMNMEKLLKIDNEKIAKMLSIIASGKNLNFDDNSNKNEIKITKNHNDNSSVKVVAKDNNNIPSPQVK